ncbi:Replication protein A 70 kDa DNA-binding subunit A-like protein [Drosera capensis]
MKKQFGVDKFLLTRQAASCFSPQTLTSPLSSRFPSPKMAVNLTRNAISAILDGDMNSKPLVQVIDVKLIGSSQERYRLLISDSVSTQHAMIATQLNDRVKSGQVRKGSVVQLVDYICSTVQNRKIIVVLNMETIILDCEIIGNMQIPGGEDAAAPKVLPNSSVNGSSMAVNSMNAAHAANNGAQNFRPTVQPQYVPPPNYKHHGPIMRNEAPARVIPIAALNPYQGRWAIKARVTTKSKMRRYNNAKGDGKVFSFDVLDSDGGEIRVTCFNAVADWFYNIIEVGKVYMISKGSLKPASKNFNHLSNAWEILLESSSSVDLCPDEDISIPKQQFSFRPISEIESAESNSILDIIGIVISVNPSVPILRKNGMETQRRIINLKDMSGRSIELTLWGDFCNKAGQKLQELFESGIFPALAVKAAKVSDFSGKSVGTISSSQIFINPDIPEAHSLRAWFDQGGKHITSQSISREIMPVGAKNEIRKTISQIRDEGLGRSSKPDWVSVRATIAFIKTDTFCYTACPLMIGDRQCNKKVTRSGNRWLCDRCNQEFEDCDYRYLLQAQIQDHTGLIWVTAFQESGEAILDCSAKELYMLKNEEQDVDRFAEVIHSGLFVEFLLKLKVKEETYGDEQKVKITIVKADRVDFASESRYLLDVLSKQPQ